MNTKHFLSAFSLVTLFVVGLAGCGKGDFVANAAAAKSKTNLQKTRNIYSLFAARNGYRGPKSEEEMRDFLENDPSIEKNIGYMSIERDGYDTITVSDRDGEKMIVRFGLKLPPMTAAKPLVLEAVGVDGMRQVILSDGKIAEYDSETCDRMIAGKWKSDEVVDRSHAEVVEVE